MSKAAEKCNVPVAIAFSVGTFMQATTHQPFLFSAWLGVVSFFIVIGVYALGDLIMERLKRRTEQ